MSSLSQNDNDFIDTFPDEDEFDRLEVNLNKNPSPPNSPSAERRTIYERPQFTEEMVKTEKRLIRIIHDQVAAAGAECMDDLTARINLACRNAGAHADVFDNTSQCVNFMSQTSFLFEKKDTDRFFRNTGFAHREGILVLVSFIQENSFSPLGCRFDHLMQFIMNESVRTELNDQGKRSYFAVYDVENGCNQPWDDSFFFLNNEKPTPEIVRNLLEDYKQYFTVTESEELFVGLTPFAFEIPSLWNADLLPLRPTQGYYDKTRLETCLVHIRSNSTYFAMGVIWAGKYAGRRVCYIGNQLGHSKIDTSKYMPVGSAVYTCAHVTMTHKNHLNAVTVRPVVTSSAGDDREALKQQLRSSIDLDELEQLDDDNGS